MPTKRVVRSFKQQGKDYKDIVHSASTLIRRYGPEIEVSFDEFGLDSGIKLGRNDLMKLGFPERIKVVIYNLD